MGDGIGMCEVCGGYDECEDECNCENCMTNRAEDWNDLRMDTFD